MDAPFGGTGDGGSHSNRARDALQSSMEGCRVGTVTAEKRLLDQWKEHDRQLWDHIESAIKEEEDKLRIAQEAERQRREEEERQRREQEEKARQAAEVERKKREEEEGSRWKILLQNLHIWSASFLHR